MDWRRSASCVWLEPIEVNRSGSDVESYIRAYGVDIVGECLHHRIRTRPGAMKFGRSAWERVGEWSITSSPGWKVEQGA